MDWFVSGIAASYVGGVMTPLPTNTLLEDIQHTITEAEVRSPTVPRLHCHARKCREDTLPISFCFGACLPMHHSLCMAVS